MALPTERPVWFEFMSLAVYEFTGSQVAMGLAYEKFYSANDLGCRINL
jgi:hypothetical protein